jgi:tetratricopeptide (TPR) repeat protein
MNEARVAFKKATELSPNWVAPRLELAKLYLVTGDYGLAWLEVEKALKIYPDSPEALFLAAQTQFKQGQYDGALKLFSRLHKDDPKNPAIHMGLGALYAAQQKFGAALKAYEEVLRIDPDRVDALNSIAQLLVQEGKSREALARVERQLSSAKDQTAILNILGDLSVEAGDAQKGIGYFKRALAINPSLAPTYLKIGSVYAGQRALDDAIEAYLKAVELAPKALQPRMMLAIMYEQKNEFSKANEAYQSILDINGKFAPAANNLAWNIAEHGGNLDVALRWAQTARENDPYNATVVDTLGWVMYRRGAFALAITLLEQSSNQFGNKNPSVLYHLGMAYYGAGKRQEAHKTLTKALALSREFKGADEAVKTVAELGGS